MKRWSTEQMRTGPGLERLTVRHRLQIGPGKWTTVATVVETTDGRWMAADVWGNRAGQYGAEKALTKAKANAVAWVEAEASWGVPW